MKTVTAKLLLAAYLALFTWAAVDPYDRATWWAENIPIVLIAATLVVLYLRGVVFSPTAYALMSVLLFLHTIGGHYTFERVPFGFVTDLFGFHRNHYDRIAHFSVGFYAYAIAEALVFTKAVRSRLVLFLFPIFTIAFVAMSYELIEWWYAAAAGGPSGAAFLGSQGDIWDAQKDMLADTLGAIVATTLFFLRGRHLAPLAILALIFPASAQSIEWVSVQNRDLYAVDAAGATRRLTADGRPKDLVTLGPGGSRVAFVVDAHKRALGTIVVVTAAGATLHETVFRPEPVAAGSMRSIEQLEWLTPDRLVVSGGFKPDAAEYAILDAPTGRELGSHFVAGFAWKPAPGGAHFAYEYFSPARFCVDDDCRPGGTGGYPKRERELDFQWGPVWSADGNHVAILATEVNYRELRTLVVMKHVKGPFHEIPAPPEARGHVAIYWDGSDLVAASDTLRWKLNEERSHFVPIPR